MKPARLFEVGQEVVACNTYGGRLTPGKVYTVVGYDDPAVTPTFTFPAYVTVIGDFGQPVVAHTHRFSAKPQ